MFNYQIKTINSSAISLFHYVSKIQKKLINRYTIYAALNWYISLKLWYIKTRFKLCRNNKYIDYKIDYNSLFKILC